MRYAAQERAWVMRLLARLTPDQRARYELACRAWPVRGANSGKLYDGEKAKIAEQILYEDARPRFGAHSDGEMRTNRVSGSPQEA